MILLSVFFAQNYHFYCVDEDLRFIAFLSILFVLLGRGEYGGFVVYGATAIREEGLE